MAPREQEIRKVSDDFVNNLKRLESDTKWVLKSSGKLTIHEIDIDGRIVAKANLNMDLPFEKVLNFFSNPTFSRKMNNILEICDTLYQK